jgi:hypothetical protein
LCKSTRIVGRGIIDDQYLDVWPVLRQHAGDSASDSITSVETG